MATRALDVSAKEISYDEPFYKSMIKKMKGEEDIIKHRMKLNRSRLDILSNELRLLEEIPSNFVASLIFSTMPVLAAVPAITPASVAANIRKAKIHREMIALDDINDQLGDYVDLINSKVKLIEEVST